MNPDGTKTYLGPADPAEDIAARCERRDPGRS
jgi:hypothetical protein